MSFNSAHMIHQLRESFEQLLTLVTGPEAQNATLDQMERCVLRRVLRLGLNLLALFIMTRVAAEAHTPLTKRNGTVLAYHQQKSKTVLTIFGKLTFARAYFYAEGLGGACPLDEALSLPERRYSDLLLELLEALGVDAAYRKGLATVARLLGLNIAELVVETAITEHSQWVPAYYAQTPPIPSSEEGPILVVQADGKGVPMVRQDPAAVKARLGKGEKPARKKEAIATAVYTIEPYYRTPQDVVNALFKKGDTVASRRPAPQHKQLFASLGGKEQAITRLAEWTARREGVQVQARVALTDGSEPLQQQLLTQLPAHTLILDIIHVTEYIWKAGTALYGETDPQRQPWVEAQMCEILSSRSERVIQRLEEKAATLQADSQAAQTLLGVANYLRRNQPYMNYAEYLRQGWPIGTGVIEGTCRHLIKDRMEKSGMRWTVAGANALLALRSVHENNNWEDFHSFRRLERHQRLYGTPLNLTEWLEQAERLEINQV